MILSIELIIVILDVGSCCVDLFIRGYHTCLVNCVIKLIHCAREEEFFLSASCLLNCVLPCSCSSLCSVLPSSQTTQQTPTSTDVAILPTQDYIFHYSGLILLPVSYKHSPSKPIIKYPAYTQLAVLELLCTHISSDSADDT